MTDAWVLAHQGRSYGDQDYPVGVFGSLEEGQAGLVDYLSSAMADHPSNALLLRDTFTLTRWTGLDEGQTWTKRGSNEWRLEEGNTPTE